jgi:hypothetical protein
MGIRGDLRSATQTINLHSTPRTDAVDMVYLSTSSPWPGQPAYQPISQLERERERERGGGIVGLVKKHYI